MLCATFNDDDDSWDNEHTKEIYTGAKFDSIGEEDDGHDLPAEGHCQAQFLRNGPSDSHINAEYISLHLSSHLGRDWCNTNAIEDLAKAELRLQEGQLNDSFCIRFALPWATNHTSSEIMCVRHVHRD